MSNKDQTAVLAIVGPTCTGKTDLSIALAKQLKGEIIALDSRTLYKGMDIGTAKPSLAQQDEVRHYALDILEPSRYFTVAEYVQLAEKAIQEIIAKGKLPILCGGTGLYASALLEGLQIPAVEPQFELRKELQDIASKQGNEAVYNKLVELDPLAASRLNVNDLRRIIRALEVCIISGKPFSQLAVQVQSSYKTSWLGLSWHNNDLHKKIIEDRLQKQLQLGLIQEVTQLWQNDEYRSVLSNSINYKEFVPYIKQEESLETACALCGRNNFQLARKQMMWFKARPAINWLTIDEADNVEKILIKARKMLPEYLLD